MSPRTTSKVNLFPKLNQFLIQKQTLNFQPFPSFKVSSNRSQITQKFTLGSNSQKQTQKHKQFWIKSNEKQASRHTEREREVCDYMTMARRYPYNVNHKLCKSSWVQKFIVTRKRRDCESRRWRDFALFFASFIIKLNHWKMNLRIKNPPQCFWLLEGYLKDTLNSLFVGLREVNSETCCANSKERSFPKGH